MMSADGRRSRIRAMTVRPPRPESKSPIMLLSRLVRHGICLRVLADPVGDLLRDFLPPGGRDEQRVVARIRQEGGLDQHGGHPRVEGHVQMRLDDAVVFGSIGSQTGFYDAR